MKPENQMWESIKNAYLREVEKSLSSVKHPDAKEIFADISCHLDNRFSKLNAEQHTWENFQAIITEMGPACDYAEFLEPGTAAAKRNTRSKYLPWLIWLSIVVVIIAAGILLPLTMVKQHRYLTISKAYWFHSDERPSSIPSGAVPMDDEGHMLFHVDEWFEKMGTAEQYRPFLNRADSRFVLKANGQPDVHANAERGCWNQEFYVRIPGKEYMKMTAGVPYTIEPVNSNTKYKWKVTPGVTICKLNP